MPAATNNFHATRGIALTQRPGLAFWSFNALVWAIYAAILMIPWIGRYPIPQMLPNKVLIAGTGIAVTGALRVLCRRLNDRGLSTVRLLVMMAVASVLGAILFDSIDLAMTHGPSSVALRWDGLLGRIDAGVPVMGRAGQYAAALMAWSLGLHLFQQRGQQFSEANTSSEAVAPDAALSVLGSKIRARDGNRVIFIDPDEVFWIAADGDYVRIHTGNHNLLIRATMKHASTVLAPLGFVRVHRSAIINPRYTREIIRGNGDAFVLLRGGARVKVGRHYMSQIPRLRSGIGD